MPLQPLESGASNADSRIVGYGGALDHPAVGRQGAERRVECVLLIGLECHQQQVDPRKLVFIDETCIKTNMSQLRGWAPKGKKPSGKAPWALDRVDLHHSPAP